MPLSEAQQKKVQDWMNQKGNLSCPCCNSRNFQTGEIIAPSTMQNGGIAIGGQTVPMVQVICNKCAHVTLFASMPIGV